MPLRPRRRDHDADEGRPGPIEGSVIRPARAHDIATIIALRALLFEAMGTAPATISDNAWQQQAARWFQLHLSDERTCIMVAEAHHVVVSCAMGQVIDRCPSPTDDTGVGGLMSNIATFPGHRRMGFSEACVEAVMDWFSTATDVETISLLATPQGQGIYERFGFEEHSFPEMRAAVPRPTPESDLD
ncbi:GNAT family N-acetyltransferase [Janibacter sp. GXQ6167]|uniref:GNAT family N-acetyltransferase n=1 Tax=Janibacter sp. GXQ6167 TaxID=3240791 RepID=UPI0035254289